MFPRPPHALAALFLAPALPAGQAASPQHERNFHPIIAGEAYRSAQPDAGDPIRWMAERGIRNVVNLRGADRTGLAAAPCLAARGQGEAQAEGRISVRHGHVSLPFAAAWAMDRSRETFEGGLGYAG